MSKDIILLASLSLLLVFILISCASGSLPESDLTSEPKTTRQEEVKVLKSNEAQETWRDGWERVVKAAKKEGKLVAYSTTGGDMRYVVGRGFQEKYGIGVEFLVAKGAQIAERIASERRVGLYIPDVYLGGAQSAVTYFKPQGYLERVEPSLILPEVEDPRFWWEGEFPWIDKDRTIIGFVAYANVPLAINTNLVKTEDISSYNDLLKPKWKSKILLNDVTMTGSGGAWFGSIQLIIGSQFMHEIAKQDPVMITDYRLQLEWLAQGKYPVLVAPHAGTLSEFEKVGAPVRGITPVEGTYRTSGSGNLALFKRLPHPETAKLFINWLLTREGQKIYGQSMGYPSARIDVIPEGVDTDRILNPKIKYINGNSEENLLKQEDQLEEAKAIFGHLKK